jgi:hypothetical protein
MDIEFQNLLEPDAPTPEKKYRRFTSSEVPFEAAYGRMMLELLGALRRDVIGPRVIATKNIMWLESPELLLFYSDGYGHSTTITVKVDYKDRSPLVDGLPLLHYRLECGLSSERSADSRDELRTRNVRTACEFIVDVIRKCRGTI